MMARLKAQRDAVSADLDALGPPPDFDLTTLRATYNAEAWDATPLAQRRKLLQVAIVKVIVTPAYRRPVSPSDRVRVVLVGEESDALLISAAAWGPPALLGALIQSPSSHCAGQRLQRR